METIRIGMLVFPAMTQLDLTGPYEVFCRIPGARVSVVGRTIEPMRSEHGLVFVPDTDYASAPRFDVLVVPGGSGVDALMEDEATLAFLAEQARTARYVTSVCTGALVLGAAGLLEGRRATTHWLSLPTLADFGAIPVDDARIVIDGKVITGGGVTAGIDFALHLARELVGEEAARAIQLMIEYAPAPPFDSGTPTRADPATVERVRAERQQGIDRRRAVVARAVSALAIGRGARDQGGSTAPAAQGSPRGMPR